MPLRLSLTPTGAQARQFQELALHVRTLSNDLLRAVRRDPQLHVAAALRDHPLAQGLPSSLREHVRLQVLRARHRTRGGIKGSGLPLTGRLLRLHLGREEVTIWTPRGAVCCPLQLGNYQRHLLRRRSAGPAKLHLGPDGRWFLRLDDPPSHALRRSAQPALESPQATERAEQLGQYDQVLQLLSQQAGPLSPERQAQQAFALYQTGATAQAEVKLLRLAAQPRADARVWLALSLMAGDRKNHTMRVQYAERGLAGRVGEHHAAWLQCSAGKGYLELGQHALGLQCIQEALARVSGKDLYAQARALYFLQNAYAMLDRLPEQQETAQQALRLFELLGIYRERFPLMLDLSYRAYYQGNSARGAQLLRDVIDLAPRHADPRIAEALLIRAEVALLHGQHAQAITDLEHARKHEAQQGRSRLNLVMDALQAEAHWRSGEWTTSRFELFVEALKPSTPFEGVVTAFYQGLCQYLLQEPSARGHFERVLDGPPLLDSFRLRAHAYLLSLQAAQRPLTGSDLSPLMHLLDTVGGEFALSLDSAQLGPLYRQCAAQGLGGRAMQRLAELSQVRAQGLHLRTLGGFEAKFQDEPLKLPLLKAQALLAYLAIHGPASRETLIDALWGEEQPSPSYFKQAVLALRHALQAHLPSGMEGVLYRAGQYRLHADLPVQVDVQAVLMAARSPHPADWQQAIIRYQGAFLPRSDGPWVEDTRTTCQDAALCAVLLLADGQAAQNQPAAEQSYRRALEIEPLSERAWQGLLHTLERQGASHQFELAQKHYQRTFLRELGIDPLQGLQARGLNRA